MPRLQGTPAIIRINLILPETTLIWQYGFIFIQIFVVGSENARILKQSAKWTFTVIEGRWFWYQLKPRVQLSIGHQ